MLIPSLSSRDELLESNKKLSHEIRILTLSHQWKHEKSYVPFSPRLALSFFCLDSVPLGIETRGPASPIKIAALQSTIVMIHAPLMPTIYAFLTPWRVSSVKFWSSSLAPRFKIWEALTPIVQRGRVWTRRFEKIDWPAATPITPLRSWKTVIRYECHFCPLQILDSSTGEGWSEYLGGDLHSTVAVALGRWFGSTNAPTAVTGIWTQIPSPLPARTCYPHT